MFTRKHNKLEGHLKFVRACVYAHGTIYMDDRNSSQLWWIGTAEYHNVIVLYNKTFNSVTDDVYSVHEGISANIFPFLLPP